MRWLIHGSLTPAVIEALKRHGHDVRTLAELSIAPDAPPAEVLRDAHSNQVEVITTDAEFATSLYEEGIRFDRCLVLLNVEGGDVEQDDAIDRLFQRYKRLTPGRLYTVTASRVKVRQLPGSA